MAGRALGITPYGTEAMHVLRAEKGFAIVGQDTDGTVTPHDLGMAWIVRRTKPTSSAGARSARRPVAPIASSSSGCSRPTPGAPGEGAQLIVAEDPPEPRADAGPRDVELPQPDLDRTFALAMLQDGRAMHGGTVFARVRRHDRGRGHRPGPLRPGGRRDG